MSTVQIKHWNRKGYLPLGPCSQKNCEREGDQIVGGKLFCSRHLTLTLVAPRPANLPPGGRIGR
jgi:hypothetical protein